VWSYVFKAQFAKLDGGIRVLVVIPIVNIVGVPFATFVVDGT